MTDSDRRRLDGDPLDVQAARLQMLDQGIESAIPRYHPGYGGRVAYHELSEVDGQMEVECVLAPAADLHVSRRAPKACNAATTSNGMRS